MLKLIELNTYYSENHVLKDVSLTVKKGCVVGLLGRNGMGKTTTIHSIIGFVRANSGTIRFKTTEILGLLPYQICRLGLAIVPQGKRIFRSLSVTENLTLGERLSKGGTGWTSEKVYSLFPVLEERADLRANMLSGGEQQMLGIGRALITNPELLLMDEPSEGLSPMVVRRIGDIIKQLKAEGLSILLVEQNLPLALSVADNIYILNKGEIVYQASPKELSENREVQGKYLILDA